MDELAAAPDELLAVLGLGGRLFGALDGRPPTEVFVADDELTNLDEETRGLLACEV